MIHFAALALAIITSLAAFVWLCLPGSRWRVLATSVFVILAVGAFGAVVESAGQAKPIRLEWRDVSSAEVVGLAWNEDQHIVWLWLMNNGVPMAYVLPWPKDQAKFGQLQDRWRRRGSTGDEFQYNADGDVAEVAPPRPQPEKHGS